MRNIFANEITSLAMSDERIMLLTGDIGNKLFDDFKKLFSDRFINCGIAEANMIGVAAGLALNGMRPIIYTITPFTTTRCFEQIRLDICYHEAPVIIIGTGSGLSYAELGPTHHSLEDLAILRTLPGLQIIAPCDSHELKMALRSALQCNIPTYIRIGKKEEINIHEGNINYQIGKAITIQKGRNILFIATGTIMINVLEAIKILKNENLVCHVASFHTIKPLDEKYVEEILHSFQLIVTVEEHSKIGGLGGAISELLSKFSNHPPLLRLGTDDEFMHEVGSQDYARKKYKLDSIEIAEQVRNLYLKNANRN